MASVSAAIAHRRVAVAVQLRLGPSRLAITLSIDASDVDGLTGDALHEAVRPAVIKALDDLVFEVVEIRED